MDETPLNWLAQVEENAAQVAGIPLWGNPPPLPLDVIAERVKESLQIEALSITSKSAFRTNFYEDFASQTKTVSLNFSPLEGKLFFIMPESEIDSLIKNTISPDPFTIKQLKEGYLHFLTLEVLEALHSSDALPGLYPQLVEDSPLPDGEALCIDLTFDLGHRTLFGRVVMSPLFHAGFREHFKGERVSLKEDPRAEKIPVQFGVEIGKTTLSKEQLEQLHVGDWVALDHVYYFPKTAENRARLTLGDQPAILASIKENQLQINQFYTHQEES